METEHNMVNIHFSCCWMHKDYKGDENDDINPPVMGKNEAVDKHYALIY